MILILWKRKPFMAEQTFKERLKKIIEKEKNSKSLPSTWLMMNDYTCTCNCGCQNPADDYVCHNCKIGMCEVGMKKWFGSESRLNQKCYYCGQLFETKEKLYDHLDVHTKISEKQAKKKKKAKDDSKDIVGDGESTLSEDEIIEQFNASKSDEPSRMSSKN